MGRIGASSGGALGASGRLQRGSARLSQCASAALGRRPARARENDPTGDNHPTRSHASSDIFAPAEFQRADDFDQGAALACRVRVIQVRFLGAKVLGSPRGSPSRAGHTRGASGAPRSEAASGDRDDGTGPPTQARVPPRTKPRGQRRRAPAPLRAVASGK